LKRPYVGVLMWAWLAYMNPHRFTWGFAYSLHFSLIVGVTTVIGFLLSKEPKRFPWTLVTGIWLLFILWMNITTLFALVPDQAWPEWERAMKIQFMTFVTMLLIQHRNRLHALIWMIVISLGFFGVKGGIFVLLTGGQYMVLGPPDSFFEGNTGMGLVLIMIMPLMRYLQLQTENVWVRRGLGISMILTTIAIVGSYSRGSLLGGAAMSLFLWLKSPRKLISGVIIILVSVLLLAYMPTRWGEKMETIRTYKEDDSSMGRINAWWFAYNLARNRPFTGGGFNTFEPNLFWDYAPNPDDFHDAHSIYFEVLGEHGFPGLGLFLALGILAWRTGTWIIRTVKSKPELAWASNLAAMIQASLVGYAAGGAFLGLAYFDLYYHLLAMLVLTRLLVERALEEEPVAQPQPEPSTKGQAAVMGSVN